MDEDLSELERLEAAKKWWYANYRSILLGALIAVVVVGGWRYWQYRVESRSSAAAALFKQLADAMQKHDDAAAQAAGTEVLQKYADTPYAQHAALALAQADATAGKTKDGEQMLQWVMDHGKDDGLKLLARLRQARLKLADADAQGAIDTLSGTEPGGFAPLYSETRGDAYVKLGKPEDARKAYQAALAGWDEKQLGDKSGLQLKLDNLPGGAPTQAPAAATKAAKP